MQPRHMPHNTCTPQQALFFRSTGYVLCRNCFRLLPSLCCPHQHPSRVAQYTQAAAENKREIDLSFCDTPVRPTSDIQTWVCRAMRSLLMLSNSRRMDDWSPRPATTGRSASGTLAQGPVSGYCGATRPWSAVSPSCRMEIVLFPLALTAL